LTIKIQNIHSLSEDYLHETAIAVATENRYIEALSFLRHKQKMQYYHSHRISMAKQREEQPLLIKCPNCKQTREPDLNETTRRYVCSICNEPVDVQVIIEKKKRGLK
jgi:hypothetical protein